ncbi:alpha-L-fucosidase [Friedmanniella luteola]|uniref:alpha-L-fucosidase n=1 Tax=Friedmanniella luteola TaxID=546871 RepID=A0A1H1XM80_9ACTN|nr:alpha-L-fucosidase [Friedmanniella luteola]SDT09919.1 alpha-L-fucosidase [Friedmanniella luteola]
MTTETRPTADRTADPAGTSSIWSDLARPLPAWLPRAKLGIFIHWGAYSVPAWAEPSGALGAVPDEEWFTHNAYAEWYANTIRIPGSPAAEHHHQTYGDAPYDDFLDAWTADRFDPAAWAALFAEAGAQYVVPTTKHHDGIALWDAPGTGTRNTVHRGPRRDLVGDLAAAVRAAGMRFGVYYSGGLDWSTTSFPPHTSGAEVSSLRPNDAAYNCYALLHVRDLVQRYAPDVLWNDINWPDAGKRTGAWSLHELFRDFYAGNPDGVVNDRWGDTHWDYRTSEYEHGTAVEVDTDWEQCRGLGFSFGYNQVEDESVVLSGHQLATLLADVVSRGGRLLLNVGPTAAGEIPALQQQSLRDLGRWTADVGETLRSATRVDPAVARNGDDPWTRWLDTPDGLVALVDRTGTTPLAFDPTAADGAAGAVLTGRATVSATDDGAEVDVAEPGAGPVAVRFPWRRR